MNIAKKTVFFLVLFLAASCKEEIDTLYPVIQFIEPQPNLAVNIPDTIGIKARITDDHVLNMVTLNLLDQNNNPVIQVRNFYPYTNDFLLETSMVLVNESLSAGPYFIQLNANDGTNSVSEFLEITINEVPLEIHAYLAVSAPLSFTSILNRLHLNFEIDSQMVIYETCALSGVNSTSQQFYFVSNEPSVITAYDPLLFEYLWEVPANAPRPEFTGIFNDHDFLFSAANGDAGIINSNGSVVLRTPAYQDKTARCLAADENYIYIGHQSLSGDINQLTVIYRVTGAIRVQEFLSAEILGLVPVKNEIMVFMLSGADIAILTYNPGNFTISETNFLETEIFKSVEKISDQELFILTERCVIVFNAEYEQFIDYTTQPYDFCRYDKLNDAVFLGKDVFVERYDRISGDLLNVIPFSEKVLDFQILYNK